MVVGDNGVLKQAQNAKIKTEKEEAKERVQMEVVGSYNDKGVIDLEKLNSNLMKNLAGIELKVKKEDEDGYRFQALTESNKIEKLPVTVRYNQIEVKITGKVLLSELVKDVDNYGKYINYPIDIDGDGKTEKDWMIFYKDENGNVFIKPADYVLTKNSGEKKPCEAIKTSIKKAGMEISNDRIYSQYWQNVPTSGIEYNDKLAKLFRYNIGNLEDNNNNCANCVKALLNTNNWIDLVNKKYANYAIGSPTFEMWRDSWNSHNDDINYPKLDIKFGNDSWSFTNEVQIPMEDKLYFPHTERIENCYGYWLATMSTFGTDTLLSVVCVDKHIGSGVYNNKDRCICPVICLKADIYVELEELEENNEMVQYYKLKE